jgi:hypothetical protein
VNASITVVTASDGKADSREHLKANPMDLMYSLLVMIRAHEESDTTPQASRWRPGRAPAAPRHERLPRWRLPGAGLLRGGAG